MNLVLCVFLPVDRLLPHPFCNKGIFPLETGSLRSSALSDLSEGQVDGSSHWNTAQFEIGTAAGGPATQNRGAGREAPGRPSERPGASQHLRGGEGQRAFGPWAEATRLC